MSNGLAKDPSRSSNGPDIIRLRPDIKLFRATKLIDLIFAYYSVVDLWKFRISYETAKACFPGAGKPSDIISKGFTAGRTTLLSLVEFKFYTEVSRARAKLNEALTKRDRQLTIPQLLRVSLHSLHRTRATGTRATLLLID